MFEKTTKTFPTGIEGRSNLPCEPASMQSARESSLAPVVTRSSDVSRSEMTTSMVLRSQVWGDRSSAAILEVGTGPEIEFWHSKRK